MSLSRRIARQLTARHQTLSLAESCTGGLLAHRLTNIPGSSAFFKGGIVAYSNAAKIRRIRVPASRIQRHGAVSAPVAKAMAAQIRRVFAADYGIGITGIAGPGGGTPKKPVGLVYIAAASPARIKVKKHLFRGTRLQIKRQAADAALQLLATFI